MSEPFSDSIYEEQTRLAERELSSFIAAATNCMVQNRPGSQHRTGSTNRTLWTARLDRKSEIGVPSQSRHRNGRTFLEGHLESMVIELRDDAQEALGQGRPSGTARRRKN
jgi:hypothetical protein